MATNLINITVFEHNLWPGLSQKEKITEFLFESLPQKLSIQKLHIV